MKPKHAHVTINGRPLCDFGMWGDALIQEHNVTCGHLSIAAAHRTKKVLDRHMRNVKVVAGDCPAQSQ